MGSQTVAGLRILIDNSQAVKSIRSLRSSFSLLDGSMGRTIRTTSILQKSVIAGASGITAALAPIKMFRTFLDYEKGLMRLNVVARQAPKELEKISLAVQNLAVEFGKKPTELLRGLEDIYQAQIKSSETMNVLRASTMLAVGGMTTVAKAADVITTIVNAYNMSANKAMIISDILFKTQEKGKVTIAELTREFGRLVGIANSANIPFKNVAAIMATLTQKGLRARLAATGMTAMFFRFAQNATKIRKGFADVGGAARALADKGIDFVLRRTQKLSKGELPILAEKMGFFRRDLTAIAILVGGGKFKKDLRFGDIKKGSKQMKQFIKGSKNLKTYFKNLKAMEKAFGATGSAVAMMMKATGIQINRIGAAFDVLSITITQVFKKDIDLFIRTLLSMLIDIRQWVKENKEIVKSIGAIVLALASLSVFRGIFLLLSFGIKDMILSVVGATVSVWNLNKSLYMLIPTIDLLKTKSIITKSFLNWKNVFIGNIKTAIIMRNSLIKGYLRIFVFFKKVPVLVKNLVNIIKNNFIFVQIFIKSGIKSIIAFLKPFGQTFVVMFSQIRSVAKHTTDGLLLFFRVAFMNIKALGIGAFSNIVKFAKVTGIMIANVIHPALLIMRFHIVAMTAYILTNTVFAFKSLFSTIIIGIKSINIKAMFSLFKTGIKSLATYTIAGFLTAFKTIFALSSAGITALIGLIPLMIGTITTALVGLVSYALIPGQKFSEKWESVKNGLVSFFKWMKTAFVESTVFVLGFFADFGTNMDMLLKWIRNNVIELVKGIYLFVWNVMSSKVIWVKMVTIISKLFTGLFAWMADNWGTTIGNMMSELKTAIWDGVKYMVQTLYKGFISIPDMVQKAITSGKTRKAFLQGIQEQEDLAMKLMKKRADKEKWSGKRRAQETRKIKEKFEKERRESVYTPKDWQFQKKLDKTLKGKDLGLFLKDILGGDAKGMTDAIKKIFNDAFANIEKLPAFKTEKGAKILESIKKRFGLGKKKKPDDIKDKPTVSKTPSRELATAMGRGSQAALEALVRGQNAPQQRIVKNTSKIAKEVAAMNAYLRDPSKKRYMGDIPTEVVPVV